VPEFPDATFTDVVRAKADTLYSFLWFDVSKEPLVIDVPDSGGRYYLLPMLDMWTDIFASPVKRTSGTGPQTYAITGPGWQGRLPTDVTEIKAPTAEGWMIGRTQTNGKKDYDAVHQFQAGLKVVPVNAWGKKGWTPPKGTFDAQQDMGAPVEQVAKMRAAEFFADFAELMKVNRRTRTITPSFSKWNGSASCLENPATCRKRRQKRSLRSKPRPPPGRPETDRRNQAT
jgi:hypothetical protein